MGEHAARLQDRTLGVGIIETAFLIHHGDAVGGGEEMEILIASEHELYGRSVALRIGAPYFLGGHGTHRGE